MIATAKAHVENYTGVTYADGEAPALVKSAALLLVSDLYDVRGVSSENGEFYLHESSIRAATEPVPGDGGLRHLPEEDLFRAR
ncbi:phage gp6-like head-tail connector protein [Noviherbaspirillum saxi]|uniref:Phage gp6-like head-tail connector protein n=2 Tax=Noviherbaspirillum saxi TaxID=2320863 RepID=A0A3A3FQ84_9BURK|nr:phage gp6-like head-tail connector protein [Noviherbaspirillum saxi]